MPWVFRFYREFEENFWEAPLFISRCKAVSQKGNRCKNETCLVHPYCLDCLPYILRVSISQSNLGAEVGKGLFANDPTKEDRALIFQKNDFICPYLGEIMSKKELEDRYFPSVDNPYISVINVPYAFGTDNFYTDGALYRGPAVYSNDALNSRYSNNAILETDNRNSNLGLYATKNIYNGQEIFTSYGDLYWGGFHSPFETVFQL